MILQKFIQRAFAAIFAWSILAECCAPGTCSWPIFIGDGSQGVVEVQSMDVNSAETSIVVGLSSTDTALTGSAKHAVQMYTVATQAQQWMKMLPDSTDSAYVYFADGDSKVLLVFS